MTALKTIALTLLVVSAGSALAETVTPPEVLSNPPAKYPASHRESSRVALRVTIDEQGVVTAVEVLESGGTDFDKAAEDAVRTWKFKPAERDGVPFSARIRIPFVFQPRPDATDAGAEVDAGPATDAGTEPDAGTPAPPAPPDAGPPPSIVAIPQAPVAEADAGLPAGIEEVSVRGAVKKANRGGSDFEIQVGQLADLVGSKKASDILELAPGIFIANEGGAGHADQVFLRGFDA